MVENIDLKERVDKEVAGLEYRYKILETLLYFSAIEDSKIPQIEKFIFNEVVRGTLEYVTLKEDRFNPPDDYLIDETGKMIKMICDTRADIFVLNMFDHFKGEMERKRIKRGLDSSVEEALFLMLKPEWVSEAYGHNGGYIPELYIHFRRFKAPSDSVMDLPWKIREEVEDFLPKFSKEVLENLIGIGRAMRKYKREDIKYIKENYHW